MPIPHYKLLGSITTEVQEAVWTNLFECSFVLPNILTTRGYDPFIMLIQGTNINIDVTPDLALSVQRFKYSTRPFISAGPEQTHVEFSMNFQVNVNLKGEMESYNIVRAWYNLGWDSQTGTLHYKRDCIGTIIAHQHDKRGMILRRVTFHNVQLHGLSGIELNWEGNSDLWSVEAQFVSDYFIDEYVDGGFTFQTPMVDGY